MRSIIRTSLFCLLTLGGILSPAFSETTPDDSTTLGAFFDGLMNDHLKSKHVAGAVVSVVKDGQLVFIKGYGYSDYYKKIPIDPHTTLFRIGSISKTFTWTAVMQLVEKGKLNLDEDVNVYLKDFKIPDGEGGPITLRHLMTHTPGFEDRIIGLFARDEKALRPYREILKEQLPDRVRPAGVEMSYSNHGTGIAAFIVEQVSGLSWDEYVESNIIQPLGLDHTTFRQPLPEHLAGRESKGYNYEDGAFKEYGFEFVPLSAVGGASTTAADMSKYMITHLQLGTLDQVKILDSATALMMQSNVFRVSPYVSGTGLGIYELVNWKGIRTIGHGGDTFWFHSLMALVPEKNLGLFVSFNTQGGDYSQIFKLFLNHFYPLAAPQSDFQLTEENSEKFTGDFRFNRFSHTDLTRIASLMSTVKVSYDTHGFLLTKAGDVQKWLAVNDSTFVEESGDEYLVFGKKVNGKYTRAFPGNLAVMPLERVPALDNGNLHLLVLVIYLTIFIFTIVYWPAAWLIRKNYQRKADAPTSLSGGIKWLGWTVSFLVLFFFTGFGASLSNPFELVYEVPSAVKIFLFIPLILIPGLLMMLYYSYRVLAGREYHWAGKIHFLSLTLALVLLLWQLNHWNLLGFKY